MAEPLPAALKIPEISRLINRANQLRNFKPAIAYWCEYRAVNQIVGKGLHTADDDCFNFTRTLIERLESTKAERADDDAIVDNTAGQAYVEQFAQETFARAERTMTANKVTRQTADTFDAAATFFDLTHEWGTPDAETLQKIKFAKFHAARILKAIKNGQDPNETNPKIEEPEDTVEGLGLDPNDPDVQLISSPPAPQAVSMQEEPDTGEPATQPTTESYFPPESEVPEPFVPSPMSHTEVPASATAPPERFDAPPQQQTPLQPSPQIPTKLPPQFTPEADYPPAPSELPQPVAPAPPSWDSSTPASSVPPVVQPQPPVMPVPAQAPAQPTVPVQARDHKDLNQAQKHAKWAISALNFEDVPTAVAELRNALAMLGAS